jgi:hypothetical protein
MEEGPRPAILTRWRIGLATRIRAYFLAGVLVTAPIGLTIYLASGWSSPYVDDVVIRPAEALQPGDLPAVRRARPRPRRLLRRGDADRRLRGGYSRRAASCSHSSEAIFQRPTPFLRGIYGATKQLLETLLSQRVERLPRGSSW